MQSKVGDKIDTLTVSGRYIVRLMATDVFPNYQSIMNFVGAADRELLIKSHFGTCQSVPVFTQMYGPLPMLPPKLIRTSYSIVRLLCMRMHIQCPLQIPIGDLWGSAVQTLWFASHPMWSVAFSNKSHLQEWEGSPIADAGVICWYTPACEVWPLPRNFSSAQFRHLGCFQPKLLYYQNKSVVWWLSVKWFAIQLVL